MFDTAVYEVYFLHQYIFGHYSVCSVFITPVLCWTLQCTKCIYYTSIMLDTTVYVVYLLRQYYVGHCSVRSVFNTPVLFWTLQCTKCIYYTSIMLDTAVYEMYSLHQYYVGHCSLRSVFITPVLFWTLRAWGRVVAALLFGRSRDRSPVVSLGIFPEASDKSMCPGSTQPLKMSIRIFLGVKAAGA